MKQLLFCLGFYLVFPALAAVEGPRVRPFDLSCPEGIQIFGEERLYPADDFIAVGLRLNGIERAAERLLEAFPLTASTKRQLKEDSKNVAKQTREILSGLELRHHPTEISNAGIRERSKTLEFYLTDFRQKVREADSAAAYSVLSRLKKFLNPYAPGARGCALPEPMGTAVDRRDFRLINVRRSGRSISLPLLVRGTRFVAIYSEGIQSHSIRGRVVDHEGNVITYVSPSSSLIYTWDLGEVSDVPYFAIRDY